MDTTALKQLKQQLIDLESQLPQGETLSMLEQMLGEKSQQVQSNLKEDLHLQGLDSINNKLDKFKQDFNLEPILSSIEELQKEIKTTQSETLNQFNQSSQASELTKSELFNLITSSQQEIKSMTGKEISALLDKITNLEGQLSFQDNTTKQQGQNLKSVISNLQAKLEGLTAQIKTIVDASNTSANEVNSRIENQDKALKVTGMNLENLRKETLQRIGNLGGGSMNRNIAIGGNTSVLSRYTDINIKAGAGTTLTYTNNNTTKYLDLTITGSAGSGIVRTIDTTTVSSMVGAVAATDYVVLANGGVQITLPDAAGNTNLYTIKNVGSSSVLIATTGGQTIDGQSNLIMPVQYTSVDLISNNSNWDLT